MKMKACIATNLTPSNFDEFLDAVKMLSTEYDVVIQGYVVVPGSSCANHGMILEGGDTNKFLDALTMAMMPARWTIVPDDDSAVSIGQFEATK